MTEHQILFDRLVYTDRLRRAGISEDHARAHADALDDALRDSVATKLDIYGVRADLRLLKRDLIITMGVIAVALFTTLTGIRFFAPIIGS